MVTVYSLKSEKQIIILCQLMIKEIMFEYEAAFPGGQNKFERTQPHIENLDPFIDQV